MSMYRATVPPFRRMLQNILGWFDKAEAHAQAKKFDVDTLLVARLAPDQYTFGRQIQAACDAAKLANARLTGKEAPVHADTERTLAELRTRVQAVIALLDATTEAEYAGAASVRISLPFAPGMVIEGAAYLNEMALPNFYFHATTAYAILRHNGVDLGKRDFIGSLSLQPA